MGGGADIGEMLVHVDKNGTPYVVDGTSRTQALRDADKGNEPQNYKVTRKDIDTPDLSYLD